MSKGGLKLFYADYVEWVKNKAPPHNEHDFRRGVGLCGNLQRWTIGKFTYTETQKMVQRMTNHFEKAGLSSVSPFNLGNSYYLEAANDKCHKNKARIQWCKDHC